MIIVKGKSIETTGMAFSSWGQVNWLIQALTQNAELIWGPEATRKPTATLLTIVKEKPEA